MHAQAEDVAKALRVKVFQEVSETLTAYDRVVTS